MSRLARWVGMYLGLWVGCLITGLAMGTVIAAGWTMWTEGPAEIRGVWVVGLQVSLGWFRTLYKWMRRMGWIRGEIMMDSSSDSVCLPRPPR